MIPLIILSNLNAIELSSISGCANNQDCKISKSYDEVINSGNHTTGGGEGIQALERIGSFINYGDIKVGGGQQTFTIQSNGYIEHFINFGTFSSLNLMGIWVNNDKGMGFVTNYGIMGSINYGANSHKITMPLTLNSFGLIGAKGAHIEVKNGSKVLIKNYMVKITKTATAFNNFTDGYTNNPNDFSHLVINTNGNGSIIFKDGDSKLILDFGSGFEFGAGYLFSKLVVDTSGNNALGVDLSRLIPKSDIYYLTQSGDNFIVNRAPQYGIVGTLHKSNIRTMNNFWTLSDAMIYPRKSYHSQNLWRSHSLLKYSPSLAEGARGWVEYPSLQADSGNLNISSLRDLPTANRGNPFIKESLDSTITLKSYESFSYRNESANRRIQRQNKRNYNRKSQNQTQIKENQTFSQNLSQSDKYYFILTPFVNHNLFFESGRYNLSGLEYGFLTAFSGKLTPSNALGAHFMMSYGNIGDLKDKDFNITNLNLNVGINYKFDMIWDMYLKARGDFFYFLNQVKTLTMFEAIKPNNLGFGASVAYGKDFNFGKGGILGIEAGLDYKALQSSTISLQNNATKSISETYNKSLYNLIYADLGVNYNKYFGNFGLNATLGIKGNITANKLTTSKIHISTFNKSVDMVLDNDNFLGYANLGASYVLNARNFDMEFSLAYYGNFGDRVISNGGGVEWRVVW